ncbi:unnamed protein product [Effrenium voratum]|uniref:Uncharacterized protein n=1 Tax=Effrenium voratum TaxID=2562239 RepID=A0AA36JM13_9DINO|nr:unnamed protein product [Effrenium voratum]
MALLGLSSEDALGPAGVRFELRTVRRSASASAIRKTGFSGSDTWNAGKSTLFRSFENREARQEIAQEPLAVTLSPELELRAQQRQRNFGTLSSSWLVKNCFSAWRSHVRVQLQAARAHQDQEAQLRMVLELQALLSKKEEDIQHLAREMEINERHSFERLSLARSLAQEAALRGRAFWAWRLLAARWSLQRRVEALEAQLSKAADVEADLLQQLEESASEHQRLEAELRASQLRQRVTAEELAALQRQAEEDAEAARRAMLKEIERRLQATNSYVKAPLQRQMKALYWDHWTRALTNRHSQKLQESERLRRELEEALRDAQHSLRRSELSTGPSDSIYPGMCSEFEHRGGNAGQWSIKLSTSQEERDRLEEQWRHRLDQLRVDMEEECSRRMRKLETDWQSRLDQTEAQWRKRLTAREEELEAKLRAAMEKWELDRGKLQDTHGKELRSSKDVFELQLQRVHKDHEEQKKLQEEESVLELKKRELMLEEMQRHRLEAQQRLQLSAMSALCGKSNKGLLSTGFRAWDMFRNQAKQEKADNEKELALRRKEDELHALQNEHEALHRKLQAHEGNFALHTQQCRYEACDRADRLLGGDGISPLEALRLSQVLSAWLLVATALHWARARELQAGQADQLRLQLEQLRLENQNSSRAQLLRARELRQYHALLSRLLRAWLHVSLRGRMEAQSETAERLASNLRSRQDLLLQRSSDAFGRNLARHLKWSSFQNWHSRLEAKHLLHGCKGAYQAQMEKLAIQMLRRGDEAAPVSMLVAWSRLARQLRFERAAQQLLSKVDFLQRSSLNRRDALLVRTFDQNLRQVARRALTAWWQEAKALRLEKQRQQFTLELRRRGERGSSCGSRLAAKFWTMKMRLLLFASFMAWRFRLARESSVQLRKALADTEAAHFAIASRSLLLSDAFRRWRRWAAGLSYERSVHQFHELVSRAQGPGRVVAVVSSIEEKRRRLLCVEAFLRWAGVLRWKQAPSPPPMSPRVMSRPASPPQVLRPSWTVLATSSPSVVRAAACPHCGNVYLADSVFCRRCGRKRDLVSLDIMRPVSATVPAPPPPPRSMAFASSPTSVTSIHAEEPISAPPSPVATSCRAMSPEVFPLQPNDVRAEYFLRAEPRMDRAEPMTAGAQAQLEEARNSQACQVMQAPPLPGGNAVRQQSTSPPPRRRMENISPDHSPIRLGRKPNGWLSEERLGQARQREAVSQPKPGDLGPAVWRANRPAL